MHEINNHYKQGYEIKHIYEETYQTTENCSGTFMGNSINMTLPKYSSQPKALMELSATAEALYRDKGNHEQR
jgi:hypothetical protein